MAEALTALPTSFPAIHAVATSADADSMQPDSAPNTDEIEEPGSATIEQAPVLITEDVPRGVTGRLAEALLDIAAELGQIHLALSSPTPQQEAPEVDFFDGFPFAEDDIDLGTPFEGEVKVHKPRPREAEFPFYEVSDDWRDLREVIPGGNFVPFSKSYSTYSPPFLRNPVAGEITRRFRKSPDFIPAKAGALRRFFELPLELMIDILEMVHPLGLLRLWQCVKPLRPLLEGEEGQKIWKISYGSLEPNYELSSNEYPPPMHEIWSGVRWSALLFDPCGICNYCGRQGALPELSLEERYCDDCFREHTIEYSDAYQLICDRVDRYEKVFDLVISTLRYDGSRWQANYESRSNCRYRKRDIDSMLEELTAWYETIDEGMIPEAGKKFEEWCNKRTEEVEAISRCAQTACSWASSVAYNLSAHYATRQQAMADKVVSRLVKSGYDKEDGIAASHSIFCSIRSLDVLKLTDFHFDQHKESWIEHIVYERDVRLKQKRKERVKEIYENFKKSLKPDQWRQLPPSNTLLCEDLFDNYIENPALEEPSQKLVSEKLPPIIKAWIDTQKLSLYESIPGAEMPPELPEDSVEGLSEEEVETRNKERAEIKAQALEVLMGQRMNLATTVFSCTSCKNGRQAGRALIGADATLTHMCGSRAMHYHSSFEFCSVGYAAAANIIRSLGMAPETVTAEEVDAVDARFFCGNCPVTTNRKLRGRKAYTWRECVLHAVMKEEDHTHAIPAWLRLTKEATEFAKFHETPAPVYAKANWGCNHCSAHYDTPVKRKAAIDHVKENHSIDAPVECVDFLDFKHRYEFGGHYRTRRIFHYGIEPPCDRICVHCASAVPGRPPRMYSSQTHAPHLFDKHGIDRPIHGRDFTKITIIATD